MLFRTSPRFKAALLFVTILLCFVELQSIIAGAMAQGRMVATTTIYLPAVMVPVARPTIVIVGPDNAAQIKTFAPALTWNPSAAGSYVVELSKDPSFADDLLVSMANATVKVTDSMVGSDIIRYPISNLASSTLYYWRVGIQLKGESSFTYGAVRTFTTFKRSSVVFPTPPTLLSPKNKGAIVGQADALVTWSAVPNALGYRVLVKSKATGEQITSRVLGSPDTSYAIPGDLLSSQSPGPEYLWQIRTLDQNGWGDYSPQSQFRWIP